ncbi:hypothetical protein [Comamonas sp. HJ-2]
MQDKITIADAPDCLNTNDKAMWVLGYQAALAARSTCLHQIQEPAAAEQAAWHAGLDEGRAQAAPAAVAVPDGWKLVPVNSTEEMARAFRAESTPALFYMTTIQCADFQERYRAMLAAATALAATPACDTPNYCRSVQRCTAMDGQRAAAAPVVLPEPDAVISELMGLVDEWGMESHLRGEAELDAQHSEATQEEIDCAKDRASKERAAWKAIESKLRALLATATGLPAQAVPVANCYSNDEGDTWSDCPDDCDFVDGRALGEEFELQASIRAWKEVFRVTKVPDETSDDYEVEPVSIRTTAAPQAQADARDALTPAARDVLAERARQVSTEGYDPDHDDEHSDGSLSIAAACYALANLSGARPGALSPSYLAAWVGWGAGWFKPSDRRRNLEKACALLLADMERIDRAAIAAAKGE